MGKQIVPVGSTIKFNTGWIWNVLDDNEIVYRETGQKSSLLFFSKKDYKIIPPTTPTTLLEGEK